MKSHNGERGSLLILSLWLLLLLALFSFSMGFRAHLKAKLMKLQKAAGPAPFTALSTVNYGRYLLESDPTPGEDFLNDAWRVPQEYSQDDQSWTVQSIDEESKININTAPAAALEAFFRLAAGNNLELASKPQAWTGGILYWRGDSWTQKPEPGAYYKKKRFESLYELLLIPGIEKTDFEMIKPYLTLYPEGATEHFAVNINTASKPVLEALIQSASGDFFAKPRLLERLLDFREGKLDDEVKTQRHYFQSEDLSVQRILGLLRLPASLQYSTLLIQILPFVTVDSRYFSVRVEWDPDLLKHYGVEALLGPGGASPSGSFEERGRLVILGWQRL